MPAAADWRLLRRHQYRPWLRDRRLLRIASAASLAVLTTSGLGYGVHAFSELGKHRPAPGVGVNILLVGTDEHGPSTSEPQRHQPAGASCHCTGAIMLVHLSQDRSRLSVVSIPRDSYVPFSELPPYKGRFSETIQPGRMNAAYALGGLPLTIRTVERMTKVHIDHYAELDFAGFMKTVDALGGVPVHTRHPLHDPGTGLDLPAGTTLLNGGRALSYVRYADPSADIGRMRRQREFVAAVINRVSASGLLHDPVRLNRAVDAVRHSVHADTGLTSADVLRDLHPAATEFASVPAADVDYRVPGVGSTVKWDDGRAAALFNAIRRDRPIPAGAADRP
ncbi:LCP family protein [Streptantibioticus ferralitis]|uniref:LCP family protein n=1 Tax=Streptantibioticus ferralitis TaxID=236510 RepID=A0ABT5ZA12_9ACTN|nr:LCP family protein [Streptantibioticus ferralitis]MDF2260386.1 LCP family protein [Streptantibioticus ferralitis]